MLYITVVQVTHQQKKATTKMKTNAEEIKQKLQAELDRCMFNATLEVQDDNEEVSAVVIDKHVSVECWHETEENPFVIHEVIHHPATWNNPEDYDHREVGTFATLDEMVTKAVEFLIEEHENAIQEMKADAAYEQYYEDMWDAQLDWDANY